MKTVQDNVIVKKDAPLLVRMPQSLKAKLIEEAKKQDMSASAVVRMALRMYLMKEH